jgi:hypothetical protein
MNAGIAAIAHLIINAQIDQNGISKFVTTTRLTVGCAGDGGG